MACTASNITNLIFANRFLDISYTEYQPSRKKNVANERKSLFTPLIRAHTSTLVIAKLRNARHPYVQIYTRTHAAVLASV